MCCLYPSSDGSGTLLQFRNRVSSEMRGSSSMSAPQASLRGHGDAAESWRGTTPCVACGHLRLQRCLLGSAGAGQTPLHKRPCQGGGKHMISVQRDRCSTLVSMTARRTTVGECNPPLPLSTLALPVELWSCTGRYISVDNVVQFVCKLVKQLERGTSSQGGQWRVDGEGGSHALHGDMRAWPTRHVHAGWLAGVAVSAGRCGSVEPPQPQCDQRARILALGAGAACPAPS